MLNQGVKWHDAKEVHPARNCRVVVMTETDNHLLASIIGVEYKDGYFNGKEHQFKDVVCWAYESELEPIFDAFREEDDF